MYIARAAVPSCRRVSIAGRRAIIVDIKIISTQCATSAGTAMSGDALGLRARAFNNPIATDAVRVKGDFVGTTWGPPV